MDIKLGADSFNKALETMANTTKMVANMTDPENKIKKEVHKDGDTTNQQHQQTVEVHVGEPKDPPQPMIIKEKPETHIHKRFPDNRALTKDECELEMQRVKLEFEENERERNFKREQYILERKERKEREEFERAERMRKEEERKKRRKIRHAVTGVVGIALLGLAGYCLCSDSGRIQNRRAALPDGGQGVISAEGAVE